VTLVTLRRINTFTRVRARVTGKYPASVTSVTFLRRLS
jgi:hypothetical protein